MRPAAAIMLGGVAIAALAACTMLVDTTGLVSGGSGPGRDASALDGRASDANASDATSDSGACASCAVGTRCVSSVCVPSSDLVAWWSFEDTGEEVADLSGNGNRGARYQARSAPGKRGSGVELAAGSCVMFPDSPSLRLAEKTALTMMAWANVVGCADPARDHGIILNKENSYELGVLCSGTTTTVQEAIRTNEWEWYGTTPLSTGGWHHVAVSWDGTTVRHYVDGVEQYSRAMGGAIVGQSTGLGVGCRGVADDGGAVTDGAAPILREWLGGTIDEVAVYGRALSIAEVAAYYEATR